MAKILVSPDIKQKFDKAHAALSDDRKKKAFATDLVKEGMSKLEGIDPPGKPVRTVPRANGNKAIAYDDAGLKTALRNFKVDKQYSNITTAARACLYSSLNIDARDWQS